MHFNFPAVALLALAATSVQALSIPSNIPSNYHYEDAVFDKEAGLGSLVGAISKFLGSGTATKITNAITMGDAASKIPGGAVTQAIMNMKPPGNPFTKRDFEDLSDEEKEAFIIPVFKAVSRFLGSGTASKINNAITIGDAVSKIPAGAVTQTILNMKPPGNPFTKRDFESLSDEDKEAFIVPVFKAISKFLGSGSANKITNAITMGDAASKIPGGAVTQTILNMKPPGNPFTKRDFENLSDEDKEAFIVPAFKAISKFLGSGTANKITNAITIGDAASKIPGGAVTQTIMNMKPPGNPFTKRDIEDILYQLQSQSDKEASLAAIGKAISKFLGSGAATKISNGITIAGGAGAAVNAVPAGTGSAILDVIKNMKPPGNGFTKRDLADIINALERI